LNRWLYVNVPIRVSFGIDTLFTAGLVQGFCESKPPSLDGYCHFTYEFFELVDEGTLVVYASFAAEGAINSKGPSTLTILAGTGTLTNFVGTVTLWPVRLDEENPLIPARMMRDNSLFLGNSVGYDAKIELQKLPKQKDPLVTY